MGDTMGDGNERNVKRTGRPFSWRYLLLLTFQRTWALEPTRVTTRHKDNPSPGINGPSASHDRNDHICRSRHYLEDTRSVIMYDRLYADGCK